MMEDKQFTIIDEDGNEFLCEIMFTFYSDDFEKSYVVYSIPGKEDDDEIEVSAAWYVEEDGVEGELFPIENEEEWELVELVLKEFDEELTDDELEA